MDFSGFLIIPYQPGYENQIIDLIGTMLVFTRDRQKSDLPLKDSDITNIPTTYSGNGGFWLALTGNQLIGTIGLLDLGGGKAKLKRLFVHSTYHGKGVGPALLHHALDHALRHQFKKVSLNTYPNMKRAQSFYLKHGFSKTGIIDNKIGYERHLIPN
jgi:ribosomal protein S18 acetylase RimI-like enzyme